MCLVEILAAPLAQAAGIKVQSANFDFEGRHLIVKGKLDGIGDVVQVAVRDKSTGNPDSGYGCHRG